MTGEIRSRRLCAVAILRDDFKVMDSNESINSADSGDVEDEEVNALVLLIHVFTSETRPSGRKFKKLRGLSARI